MRRRRRSNREAPPQSDVRIASSHSAEKHEQQPTELAPSTSIALELPTTAQGASSPSELDGKPGVSELDGKQGLAELDGKQDLAELDGKQGLAELDGKRRGLNQIHPDNSGEIGNHG